MSKSGNHIVMFLVVIVNVIGCRESNLPEKTLIRYYAPKYNDVNLVLLPDTLHFLLNDTTFNNIKSMNCFTDHGIDYLSVYDERSESINIFNLTSRQLVRNILPKRYLPDKRLYKTTVYCRNFDSIFISNNEIRLYMLDSSGQIKDAAKYSKKDFKNVARLENSNPVVLRNSFIIVGIRPSATINSIKAAREWRIMYQLNLPQNKKARLYQLPVRYLINKYDYRFIDYSYCFNNNSRFVFSFPADSNLYETDLFNLHIAYFAKSQWQQSDIKPLSNPDKKSDSSSKQFLNTGFYGAVYFDPYHKRYLRWFKRKISKQDYVAEENVQKSTVLIFNENLQIIGEANWPDGVSFSTLFFTKDGRMYARVNKKDENALHFVRLIYKENGSVSTELGKQETSLKK